MTIENFIPEKTSDPSFFKVLIVAGLCPTCQRRMVDITRKQAEKVAELFPIYHKLKLEAQLKNIEIVFRSDQQKDSSYICEVCASEGKASFKCALCGQTRKSNEEQASYGADFPDRLCTVCYNTVSAKVWDAKEKELWAEHRYDYE